MKRMIFISMMIAFCLNMAVIGQADPKQKGLDAITIDAIKGQLEFLASDWTEGRQTGERGIYLAGDYVASMFKVFGIAPGGDPGGFGGGARGGQGQGQPSRTYFQNFSLIETVSVGATTLTIKKGNREMTFQEQVDFTTSRASATSKFEAQIVFVGYGINDKDLGINDFAGLDVKGKVILRLTGFPGENDPASPMYKKIVKETLMAARADVNRKKSVALEGLGITGIIEVSPGTDIGKRLGIQRDGINLSYNEPSPRRTTSTGLRMESATIPTNSVNIAVNDRLAGYILQDSGIDIAKYITDAAAGTVKPRGVILASNAIISTQVDARRVRVRNVVAMIEGERTDEFVAVGAHMDHMGMEPGVVWNGADDNASGTIGVIMVAKAIAATGVKPKRTILFCAWTAEEKGLIGSAYFAKYPTMGKISDFKFYLNYDMIARDVETDALKNKAGMQFTSTYPKIEEWTKSNIDKYKINLDVSFRGSERPSGGSDFSSFSAFQVPVAAWMAAMHPDYHRPTDSVEKINWEKMQNIIRIGFLQVWDAANNDLK